MDNENKTAPIIPAGTEPTVYGTTVFQADNGQAASSPDVSKPQQVAPAANPQAPQEGTTFEELAVKKGFKSADDLARSYAELESRNTRVEMGLSELVRVRTESQPQTEANASVETAEDAVRVVEGIVRKQIDPLRDQLQLQDLFLRYPDAKDFAPQMAKVIKDNPGTAWEVAYRAAKFDALASQAKKEGTQQAYQTIQQKQSASVEPARPAVTKERNLDELIRDKSIPFSEIQKIVKERFSQ